MRAYFVVVLVVATLVARPGALDSRRATGIMSPDTPQWSTAQEDGLPTKRHLRKKELEDESEEERVIESQFSSVTKLLEKLPSIERKGLLDEFKKLSPAYQAGFLKRLESLNRQDIIDTTGKVPYFVKKFPDSWAGRILQYNAWIWKSRTPEWVEKRYPAFAKGYDLFYNNRMTGGYKYA
ncbi:hypothetical protein PHYPSEUDO_011158 [Phytophthora pseudosyringae]|uniref:RxLR effector protein n=1 Tax=Phytophthora pseudosyringae TaxID=221518 RepID=A0A8T1V9Q0_9STRA|nr:hypothetical protein PHYPSEUDO_011158 [Phytophthora pseudosyringae]